MRARTCRRNNIHAINTCPPSAHRFAYDLVALQRQKWLRQAEANSDHVACAIEMYCLMHTISSVEHVTRFCGTFVSAMDISGVVLAADSVV